MGGGSCSSVGTQQSDTVNDKEKENINDENIAMGEASQKNPTKKKNVREEEASCIA